MMQTYHFIAVVGAQTPVFAAGSYLRYVAAQAGATNPKIRVKTDMRDEIEMLPGQSVKLPKRATEFRIGNVDGIHNIAGSLMIGDGSMDDNRVGGEVLMLDGTYSRSVAQIAFTTDHIIGATAAQYTHAQLWNPLGSGKLLVCHTIRMATLTAVTAALRIQDYNAALTTYVGQAKSKYLGAVPGGVLGEVRQMANASILGSPLMVAAVTQAGVQIELQDPFIIPPGRGLMAVCGTVNIGMNGSFDHYWIQQA